MRSHCILAGLMLAAAPSAAQAQTIDNSGVPTVTQERLREGAGDEIPWDLFGLFGLLGLLGLRREHADDSYHPASVD